MPTLDVSESFLAVEFADRFDVIRQPTSVNWQGRNEISTVTFPKVVGTVYPTGDNSLVRTEDYQLGRKTITLVTRFRLQMSSPGYQPDIVHWRGDNFIVRNIQDYSQFGTGMIVAEASSVDYQDMPPGQPG